MKIRYDLHIHSALSPCADDNMTPANVVGVAKLEGLDAIAIADHNAIANVQCAQMVGETFGVVVLPAIELQTCEDVHVLCLFEDFCQLQAFYDTIKFADIQNKSHIFGNQLIVDQDDNVVDYESRLLLVGCNLSASQLPKLVESYGGIAIPAHVDREENGMVAILGDLLPSYGVVELSPTAKNRQASAKGKKFIINSDAHTLTDIGKGKGVLEVAERSPNGILQALRSK